MKLIFCLGDNRKYPALARSYGWHIGARLPCTLYPEYFPLAFADQEWTKFDGLKPGGEKYDKHFRAYVAFVALHHPAMASVVDWEEGRGLDEVLMWAEAVAPHIERVMIIPKIPGEIDRIPPMVGDRPVVLGVSIPTRHGATSCLPIEFAGRPVHLLGGSIRQQLAWAATLTGLGCEVVSADGNSFHKAAGRGTFWSGEKWVNEGAGAVTTEEALRRSLENIPHTWARIGWALARAPQGEERD
jgi:hypothetical protein